MKFQKLETILSELLPKDSRPVVTYSGIWNIASAFEGDRKDLVPSTLETLLDAVGRHRTLAMPTYTSGFGTSGTLDLDTTPGFTGAVNESLRLLPDAKRSRSAFFSFASVGPEAAHLQALKPEHVWGAESLFEWIHLRDAHLIMIGVPLHMCSFLHRVEWLGRVPYRYEKSFSGNIILNGNKERLDEKLFVRSYDPMAENIWPEAEALLERAGLMQRRELGRGFVLHINAKALVDRLMKVMKDDPYAFVKNPEILRAKFGPGGTFYADSDRYD